MEPHKEVFEKNPEQRPEARDGRFQIVKLEERIAPGCNGHGGGSHYNPHGTLVGGNGNGPPHCGP